MTEAQLVSLSQALRNANVDYQVEKIAADNFNIRAISSVLYTATQLQALETAHGVTARTNRAVFS